MAGNYESETELEYHFRSAIRKVDEILNLTSKSFSPAKTRVRNFSHISVQMSCITSLSGAAFILSLQTRVSQLFEPFWSINLHNFVVRGRFHMVPVNSGYATFLTFES